jgi:hypothetical protein
MLLRGRRRVTVLLRNISTSGLSARVGVMPVVGEEVTFFINGIGEVSGEIRWVRDNHIGVRLNAVIDPMAMVIERATPNEASPEQRPIYAHLFAPADQCFKRPRMAKP